MPQMHWHKHREHLTRHTFTTCTAYCAAQVLWHLTSSCMQDAWGASTCICAQAWIQQKMVVSCMGADLQHAVVATFPFDMLPSHLDTLHDRMMPFSQHLHCACMAAETAGACKGYTTCSQAFTCLSPAAFVCPCIIGHALFISYAVYTHCTQRICSKLQSYVESYTATLLHVHHKNSSRSADSAQIGPRPQCTLNSSPSPAGTSTSSVQTLPSLQFM